MSQVNKVQGVRLLEDQSLTSSFNTDAIVLKHVSRATVLIEAESVTIGTGTFGIQKRIRTPANDVSGWCDLTLSSTPTLAGAAAAFEVQLADLTPCELRVSYTSAGGVYAVQTLTFPTQAGAVSGDFVTFYDASGAVWALWLDVEGTSANVPTSSVWTSIAAANKCRVDISGATTAASVAALAETAIDAMTGFTAVITSDDTAADGTMTLTQTAYGAVTLGSDYAKASTTPGSGTTLAIASTTAGGPDGTCTIWYSMSEG